MSRSEIHDSEHIPPIGRSPSVHDVNSSHYHNLNDSLAHHEQLLRRFMPDETDADKRQHKPINRLTADVPGQLKSER